MTLEYTSWNILSLFLQATNKLEGISKCVKTRQANNDNPASKGLVREICPYQEDSGVWVNNGSPAKANKKQLAMWTGYKAQPEWLMMLPKPNYYDYQLYNWVYYNMCSNNTFYPKILIWMYKGNQSCNWSGVNILPSLVYSKWSSNHVFVF